MKSFKKNSKSKDRIYKEGNNY